MTDMAINGIDLAPGRVRGEWTPNTLYLVGDLICLWFDVDESPDASKYLWFVAKQTHTSEENTKPILESAFKAGEHAYWEPSHWVNISEEFTEPEKVPNLLSKDTIENYRQKFHSNTHTAPEHRFQRVHSISPEMLDDFVLGKGIPGWYYYDMLGSFSARSNIRHPLELLTTIRGTILGLKAWLNFINFNVKVARISPEEYYELINVTEETEKDEPIVQKQLPFDNSHLPKYESDIEHIEGWFKRVQETIEQFYGEEGSPTPLCLSVDSKSVLPNARVWSNEVDYKRGDYVFENRYTDENGYYSTDRSRNEPEPRLTYYGCDLFRAKKNIYYDDDACLTTDTDAWEWITSYKIKETQSTWDPEKSPDNNFYRLEITQISDNNSEKAGGKTMVVGEKWQSTLMLLLQRFLEFLIPAWVRVESGIRILDKRRMTTLTTSHAISDIFSDTCGPEPYTLTIYPYVGFDPCDVNYVDNHELNHTEAWKTEVKNYPKCSDVHEYHDIWFNEETKDLKESIKGFTDWERIKALDNLLLNDVDDTDNAGAMKAYMWREDYLRRGDRALIKVRLLSGHKLKLKSWKLYDTAEQGHPPPWDAYTVYHSNDIVKVVSEDADMYYKSLIDGNDGRDRGSTFSFDCWEVVSDPEGSMPVWTYWKTYALGDIVLCLNRDGGIQFFKSITDNNKGNLPPEISYWRRESSLKITIPTWTDTTSYDLNDVVKILNYRYYKALKWNQDDNPRIHTGTWEQTAYSEDIIPIWNSDMDYEVNNVVKYMSASSLQYYKALKQNTRQTPWGSNSAWEQTTYSEDIIPIWDPDTNYEVNKVVKYPHDFTYFRLRKSLPKNSLGTFERRLRPLAWKLISYIKPESQELTGFWRWQLLNYYHNVPRFAPKLPQVKHAYLTYYQFQHKGGKFPTSLNAYTHGNIRETLAGVY